MHRDGIEPAEIVRAGRCRVISPLRTAWVLSRRLDRTEAVVAVDALARRGRFPPDRLLQVRAARPGARGAARLDQLVVLADPGAESPMETRLRLLLVNHGLPAPQVQYAAEVSVRAVSVPGISDSAHLKSTTRCRTRWAKVAVGGLRST